MNSLLDEFKQLMDRTPLDEPGSSVELLLGQVESTQQRLVRLCAIPHVFTPRVLKILAPDLDDASAEQLYEQLTRLPLVVPRDAESSLHDEARGYLFRQWLEPERAAEFTAANERLTRYFEGCRSWQAGAEMGWVHRSYMFHLIGANQARGFAEYENLWRQEYYQFRLGGCHALTRLVHEYDSVLAPEYFTKLCYYEGTLSIDFAQWDRAEETFNRLLTSPTVQRDAGFRVRVLLRMGLLARRRSRWGESVAYFQSALETTRGLPDRPELQTILHDVAVSYLDAGELDKARECLTESLAVAKARNDLSAMAATYNGLGMMYLRANEPPSAVQSYQKSLECLEQIGDQFRPAEVYNNLGLAYLRLQDWSMSERYFKQSLEIKTRFGDTLGRATTLQNLALIYQRLSRPEESVEALLQAHTLFLEMRDVCRAAMVKANLGRLYRKLKKPQEAEQAFSEALGLFERGNAKEEADQLRCEMAAATRGLPWWVWVVFVLSILFGLLIWAAYS